MLTGNREILEMECMLKGFQYDGENLFTYNEWKQRGYQVKKGEKCFIKTKLWKALKNKEDDKNSKEDSSYKFVMITSCLFTNNQVELINK